MCSKKRQNRLGNASLILELAKQASGLFKLQNAEQKRRLINLVTSNCIYKDEKLDLELAKPFDMIMETSKSGKWLHMQDSFINRKIEFDFSLQNIKTVYSSFGIEPTLFSPQLPNIQQQKSLVSLG
ncbi:MAG: hypothetical protein V1646_02170 [bacterium]